ncbi:MAG: hypothetical protein GEV11_21665 [Streptosporangiales bacterium]|nr:hypothetical protein [Streptosporangiales bacterium]
MAARLSTAIPGAYYAAMVVTLAGVIVCFGLSFFLIGIEDVPLLELWFTVAGWFAAPFDGLFSRDTAAGQALLNWSLAAVVYFAAGAVLLHRSR